MATPKRRRNYQASILLDLTPMVDVVFLLIIFFMVSTTFITLESSLPVDLPRAQSTPEQVIDDPTITITQNQDIIFMSRPISEAELIPTLQAELSLSTTGNVILRADQSVPHGLVVRIMDQIKQAGAQRISIAAGGG